MKEAVSTHRTPSFLNLDLTAYVRPWHPRYGWTVELWSLDGGPDSSPALVGSTSFKELEQADAYARLCVECDPDEVRP